MLEAGVVLHHFPVGGVHLVVRRVVRIVLFQHVQVEEFVILLVNHRLEVGWQGGPTKLPVKPVPDT